MSGLSYFVSYSSSSSRRGQLSVPGENNHGVSCLPLSSLPSKPGPERGHPSLRRVRVPTPLDSGSRMGIAGHLLEIQMLRSQPRPAGAALHLNKVPAKLCYRHAEMKTRHRGGREAVEVELGSFPVVSSPALLTVTAQIKGWGSCPPTYLSPHQL